MSNHKPDGHAPPTLPEHPEALAVFAEMKPFLPPPQSEWNASPSGLVHPVSAPVCKRSMLQFLVHPGLPELASTAEAHGWFARGWTTLSIHWQELIYSTDEWKTVQALRSSDVPCPVMNGVYFLPDVPPGTEVVFAIHVGFACHAPGDLAGVRAEADLWLNNDGRNYRQRST